MVAWLSVVIDPLTSGFQKSENVCETVYITEVMYVRTQAQKKRGFFPFPPLSGLGMRLVAYVLLSLE
jgi:hypothetical protein